MHKKIGREKFVKYIILFPQTGVGIIRCENGKRNYTNRARLSEDYKTRISAQAMIAVILFAKQFTCESIENCIIDIVHFRSFGSMLITSGKKNLVVLDNSVAIMRDMDIRTHRALTG